MINALFNLLAIRYIKNIITLSLEDILWLLALFMTEDIIFHFVKYLYLQCVTYDF